MSLVWIVCIQSTTSGGLRVALVACSVVVYSTKGVIVNYGKDYDGTEDEPDDREGKDEWLWAQADALYDQGQEEGIDNDQ